MALQEQLFQKDLPRLAEIFPDLRYDILKGRARYVCESRLESVIQGVINDVAQEGLLTGELFQDAFTDARRPASRAPVPRRCAGSRALPKNSTRAVGTATSTPWRSRPTRRTGARSRPTPTPATAGSASISGTAPYSQGQAPGRQQPAHRSAAPGKALPASTRPDAVAFA
ncbi:hypothetical protein [Polaromonas hydrogenivorans]|uniref:hypothetical protein n=1 Tax=Polaromonas hydrogenivorans TaxID=335476 RepID=UPI0039F13263